MIQYLPFIGDMMSKFFGNEEKRDQYQANARSDVYKQFAAEFGHNKTWWDSLIDGINRLPRPIMTFGTIYLFWLCWTDPETFVYGAQALQVMPKEGWYVLGAVVTFWFAAKLPKDFGRYKMKADINKVAKDLSRKSFSENNVSDPQEGIEWNDRVSKRYGNFND